MKRWLPLVALALLALTAGCSSVLGPSPASPEELAADANYDWDTGSDAHLDVTSENYTAVYSVANRTTGSMEGNYTIEFYTRDTLGTDVPLDVRALQFQYANGTRLVMRVEDEEAVSAFVYPNGTTAPAPGKLAVRKTRQRTIVSIPTNESGQVAFTTPRNGKQVATPTFVKGSYSVTLPPSARVNYPLLSRVTPDPSSSTLADDRVTLQWDSVTTNVLIVRWYLERDLLLFGGIVLVFGTAGVAGALYYYREISRTVAKREEVGVDVEIEDDDRGPPPGMG
ncbi:DUF5803 family protein [Natronomonas sp. EA1]|uniref:DUF5803 family protein n=1 Tax=Natronomonas sp. EA1 TaxID=3421655 RepID=UPI003EC12B33